jgi:hypothetical protein
MDYFALDVNGGKAVKNFANVAAPAKQVVVETTKGTTTTNVMSSATSHEKAQETHEGGSCGCGKSGGCGCGNSESEAKGDSCGCGSDSCGC